MKTPATTFSWHFSIIIIILNILFLVCCCSSSTLCWWIFYSQLCLFMCAVNYRRSIRLLSTSATHSFIQRVTTTSSKNIHFQFSALVLCLKNDKNKIMKIIAPFVVYMNRINRVVYGGVTWLNYVLWWK